MVVAGRATDRCARRAAGSCIAEAVASSAASIVVARGGVMILEVAMLLSWPISTG
jgi:hypothetical protein